MASRPYFHQTANSLEEGRMLDVRVIFDLQCKDGSLLMYRDIQMPIIHAGMHLSGMFNLDDDIGDEIQNVEYDHKTGRISARLGDPRYSETTLDDIRTGGDYAGWTIEWFEPFRDSDTDPIESPVLIGG